MTWQECFEEYGYHSLINWDTNNIRTIDIELFRKDGKVPQELREVYISSKGDELFLVLQPSRDEDIKEFCNYWDSVILTWVQFGKLPGNDREGIRKLQYNVTMILLYANKKSKKLEQHSLMDEPASFELEKDTSVSRKVFLACEEDNTVEDDDKLQLPFWYGKFETVFHDLQNNDGLESLLPKGEEEKCLLKKREKIGGRGKKNIQEQMYFTDREFQAVKGWIENV